MKLSQSGWWPWRAVGVLVEVRPVEVGEAVLVGREVGRHPVEDDPDAALVEGVHEVHQVLGRALAAGGGEVPEALVAPRAVEGVLHHRQELHVGEAHLLDVVGERGGQLPVGQEAPGLPGVAAPGAEVHLVGRAGRGERLVLAPLAHPRRGLPTRSRGPRRRSRCAAASRGGRRRGRPCRPRSRRGGRPRGTCTRPRGPPPARSPRRGPTGLAGAGGGGRRPFVELAHDRDPRRPRRPDREGRPVLAAPASPGASRASGRHGRGSPR